VTQAIIVHHLTLLSTKLWQDILEAKLKKIHLPMSVLKATHVPRELFLQRNVTLESSLQQRKAQLVILALQVPSALLTTRRPNVSRDIIAQVMI
jgi:hypothetical protein